jgi:hypothetical protein
MNEVTGDNSLGARTVYSKRGVTATADREQLRAGLSARHVNRILVARGRVIDIPNDEQRV